MSDPLKFILRCSANFSPSQAEVTILRDAQGNPAILVQAAEFAAARVDPRLSDQLQKLRFARALQIQAAFQLMALRLIGDLEAQESHWSEFEDARMSVAAPRSARAADTPQLKPIFSKGK